MLKFAILMIALISQINTIASVMMSDIALAFPGASDTVVQYVMQMGMVGGFIISFALSFLMNLFKKKTLVLVGMVLIMVGGLTPILVHGSIYLLWVFSFLVGAGQGIILPTLSAMILESFTGDERNRMLGLNTACYNAASAVLLVVAGFLCKTGWVNVYFCYFIVLPVFAFAVLFLHPADKEGVPSVAAEGPAAPEPVKKGTVPLRGIIQCCMSAMLMIGYAVFPLNLSLYVVRDAAIGDASSVGTAMSAVTIVAALVSLVMPRVVKVVKLYIGTVAAVFGLLANVLVMIAHDMTLVYLAAVADGIFFGFIMSGGIYIIGKICTREQYGPTCALSTSFASLGTIFCPIIINFLSSLWGGDLMKSGTAFITAIGVFAVMTVVQFFWETHLMHKVAEEEAEGRLDASSAVSAA